MSGKKDIHREGAGEAKERYMRRVFALIAPRYDTINAIISWGLVRKWRRAACEKTGLSPGQKALDVCTGTGELAFLLAARVQPGGEVYGLDFSPEMLQKARNKQKARAKQDAKRKAAPLKVRFIRGNALCLPFPDDTFDCVTCGFALRNVSDISRMISEMKRVCKKGGKVVCLELSVPENPVFRLGFFLYFHYGVPLFGKLCGLGRPILNKEPPYSWLACSLNGFPVGKDLSSILIGCGLRDVGFWPLSLGVVSVYTGIKH